MIRPMLMNAPMVRAILDGSKTQTRRVLRLRPPDDCALLEVGPFHPQVVDRHGDFQPGAERFGVFTVNGEWSFVSPHGQPGDQIWVRETFQKFTDDGAILFRADPESAELMQELKRDQCLEAVWKPSIFMPRWASRITLEITGVRVERLQDISEADAIAEGIENVGGLWKNYLPGNGWTSKLAIAENSYRSLWDAINGPESWAANHWVWVVEFNRVKP